MEDYLTIINDTVNRPSEEEWFEFKENWFEQYTN